MPTSSFVPSLVVRKVCVCAPLGPHTHESPKPRENGHVGLVPAVPRITLIDDLTDSQIPPGSNILVEFDPASQWYNASIAIACGWIATGGKVDYHVMAQPPERIRSAFQQVGLHPDRLEREGSLQIVDYYTATLGRKSREKLAVNSLKVAELSIEFAKEYTPGKERPDTLSIGDNVSTVGRFNDEKSWIEFALTRVLPGVRTTKLRGIDGLLIDLHSPWVYRQSEAA